MATIQIKKVNIRERKVELEEFFWRSRCDLKTVQKWVERYLQDVISVRLIAENGVELIKFSPPRYSFPSNNFSKPSKESLIIRFTNKNTNKK